MRFSYLSNLELAILSSALLISLTLIIVSTVFIIAFKKSRLIIIFSVLLLIITAIDLNSILEINWAVYAPNPIRISKSAEIIDRIPSYLHYVLVLVVTVFSSASLYWLYKNRKNSFSNYSIKEILETSNSGLVYYNDSGYISLSNHMIQEISVELTGKVLQNGIEFERDIKELQKMEACLAGGKEPIFALKDKSVWRFSKNTISINKEEFSVIRVDNITETYKLTEQIKEANEKLELEQKRLEEYLTNMETLIAEEESLRIKMMIHDEFGELIILTARAYELGLDDEAKAGIIDKWGSLNEKMKEMTSFVISKEFSLERVIKLGELLNCQINIDGELPKNVGQYEVIINGIYESLKNAVYHTKTDKLFVTINENDDNIIVMISNENENKPKEIIEGGGLSNLRSKVEKLNGTMEIVCDDSVTLIIRFKNDNK